MFEPFDISLFHDPMVVFAHASVGHKASLAGEETNNTTDEERVEREVVCLFQARAYYPSSMRRSTSI